MYDINNAKTQLNKLIEQSAEFETKFDQLEEKTNQFDFKIQTIEELINLKSEIQNFQLILPFDTFSNVSTERFIQPSLKYLKLANYDLKFLVEYQSFLLQWQKNLHQILQQLTQFQQQSNQFETKFETKFDQKILELKDIYAKLFPIYFKEAQNQNPDSPSIPIPIFNPFRYFEPFYKEGTHREEYEADFKLIEWKNELEKALQEVNFTIEYHHQLNKIDQKIKTLESKLFQLHPKIAFFWNQYSAFEQIPYLKNWIKNFNSFITEIKTKKETDFTPCNQGPHHVRRNCGSCCFVSFLSPVIERIWPNEYQSNIETEFNALADILNLQQKLITTDFNEYNKLKTSLQNIIQSLSEHVHQLYDQLEQSKNK